MSERDLIRAYGLWRDEPCACGGTVRAEAPDRVEEAVRAHQRTRAHRAWRDRLAAL